tara:strand:- start:83454 stop:83654 length:201 start_codon:yes stop_codon:yes gene_type:complete
LIEYIREEHAEDMEDFTDLDALVEKSKSEDAFFSDIQSRLKLAELDKVMPFRYDYQVKKQETQQDV